jgi:UDP-N-acetylglucosamine 2-epimerase (hydrolysing)
MKRILFITGTRADYGKIKPLMQEVLGLKEYELHIFVTGMHMLSKYGSTHIELEKDGFKNLYKYINQTDSTSMDLILSNTILGISNYVNEYEVDLLVVHGDRVEALAGAIVGALNNIRVAHIEGGEVSGTIDESIRHAVSKFSHLHFVANEAAKRRLIQLGEDAYNIYIIGSPDIDVMLSDKLPGLKEVQRKYEIPFEDYGILMYHPVTTEVDEIKGKIKEVVDAVLLSDRNYIVIFPNNDNGSREIIEEYKRLSGNERFKIFPSVKFEYFLTMLKYCEFIIGNSSAGIREASIYKVPAIDIGSRQNGRYSMNDKGIIHSIEDKHELLKCIQSIPDHDTFQNNEFGDGNSSKRFIEILQGQNIWDCKIQKKFIDVE